MIFDRVYTDTKTDGVLTVSHMCLDSVNPQLGVMVDKDATSVRDLIKKGGLKHLKIYCQECKSNWYLLDKKRTKTEGIN